MNFIPKMLLILSATAKYQWQPESLGTCHLLEGGGWCKSGEGHYILCSQKGEGHQKIQTIFVNITVDRYK